MVVRWWLVVYGSGYNISNANSQWGAKKKRSWRKRGGSVAKNNCVMINPDILGAA